jgi:hypothetical protein
MHHCWSIDAFKVFSCVKQEMWDDSCLGWPGRLHQVYDVIQKTMLVRVTVKAWDALLVSSRTYGKLDW